MTFKLPEALRRGIEDEARRRGVAKSALVRGCVETMLRQKRRRKAMTCLDLISDLVGSQPGPPDASANEEYLKGAVLADYAGGGKNTR